MSGDVDSRVEIRVGDDGVRPYPLLTALVVPRPIAWVSTVDAEGVGNLAPHSFFSVACGDPPVVMFTSLGRKDSLRNIEATHEFVVNLATEPLLHQVNDSSAPFPFGTDEAEILAIETEPSTTVQPRRVRHSPAALECTLNRIIDLGTAWVVLGDVRLFAVAPAAMTDGHPQMDALRPLSRLGGDEWGHPPEVFHLRRPRRVEDVATPDQT